MSYEDIRLIAENARMASQSLPLLSTKCKDAVLKDVARTLIQQTKAIVLANTKDVDAAKVKGLSKAMIDRLMLDAKRIKGIADAVVEITKLKDPVGMVVEKCKRLGIRIEKVRIPLGVIGMIYESRPNVTIDAAALCFKSGNAIILRGGSEAFHSNDVLVKIFQTVLKKHKIDPDVVSRVPDTDRQSMIDLLSMDRFVDVIIPRGGEGLMRFIAEHTRIPVIKHDKGVCSLFVDKDVAIDKAIRIIQNAKVQRPGVCNALENLFVHQAIAKKFLPKLQQALSLDHVELRGDQKTRKILPEIKQAEEGDFTTEYLDLILSIKIVKDVQEAIQCVYKYSSNHTDGILTPNKKNADLYKRAITSSCVVINSSTRFNDGGQLGLGAEIGISTTKLHAYGPMGLNELTTTKYIVESDYKVRVS